MKGWFEEKSQGPIMSWGNVDISQTFYLLIN